MHNLQRLSPAAAGLLTLEEQRRMPLHAGAVLLFDGPPPSLAQLRARVSERLVLLPRYRAILAGVPLGQGRPLWTPDGAFALEHHVRAAALPGGAGDAELAELAARVFEAPLERARPLWQLWLVENVAGGRFALIAKTHPALVGAERDLLAISFDGEAPVGEPAAELEPAPAPLALLAQTLAERARSPRESAEAARALAARVREELRRRDLDPLERLGAPPRSRLNAAPGPGPGRSFAWVDAGLKGARRAKERLGGTLNDVVLTAVAGALGRYLREHGDDTDGLLLRALVPLADGARPGVLLASYAPLPVGIEDPRRRHAEISRALDGLRTSGRARGAADMLEADEHAPAAVIARAAALAAAHRGYNVAIANVPGPQSPLLLLGRELRALYPALPLLRNQSLSVSVVSYAGRLCFGLLADADAIADLDLLAGLLRESLRELPKAPATHRR